MARRKSRLSVQKPKNPYKKKNIYFLTTNTININEHFKVQKRKHVNTPLSTPRKSPFKSPLYIASPAHKKKKLTTSRPLFQDNNNNSSRDNTSFEFSDFNPLETTTTEPIETCTPCSSSTFKPSGSSSKNKSTLNIESCIEEAQAILPEVFKKLANNGRLDLTFLNFFQEVKENQFPLNNIALLLWAEVVSWFRCDSTTEMRYYPETKQFWKLGWKIFGGKFVNFMGGYKSHGDNVLKNTEKGRYNPESSEINFAVPDVKVLRAFDPYDVQGERKPGIYTDIISVLSQNLPNKSACLTFDGKKLKQDLKHESGDVDLLGYEDGVTLAERNSRLVKTIDKVNEMIEHTNANQNGEDVESEADTDDTKSFLLHSLQSITANVIEVKELKRKKEYCKLKLIERGGETDWRKGKFAYAISAVIAFLYDIEQFLQEVNDISEKICKYLSSLNNCPYVIGETVNLQSHNNFFEIDEQEGPVGHSRLVKQRSDEWHSIRNEAKVTGSTLYGALGCDSLKKMKTHFEKVICGIPENEFSEEALKAMEHGTQNEINAVATIVGKILPTLESDKVFCEEGCVKIEVENGNVMMVVSPDGSLRADNTIDTTLVAIEIKCPVSGIHTKFPPRYLLQCLSEIEALNASYLLYVSWTETESMVFKVERNITMFQEAMKIAMDIYGDSKPKKPTKLSDEQKKLKNDIIQESKNVQILGRFKSLKAGDKNTDFDHSEYDSKDVMDICKNLKSSYNRHFELNRERATEAVVFLIADLDRSWNKKKIRCSPVAWFPKGYSLTTHVMRQIAEEVHTQCQSKGLHVPCQSFDGQWHGIVVRTVDDKPLTELQLQKDVWHEVEKMNKKAISNILRNLNKDVEWKFSVMITTDENESKSERSIIVASNGGIRLPIYRPRHSQINDDDAIEKEQIEDATLTNLPIVTDDQSNMHSETLTSVHQIGDEEMEILLGNINNDKAVSEIDNIVTVSTAYEEDSELLQTEIDDDDGESDIRKVPENETTVPETNLNHLCRVDIQDMKYILALFQTTKDCNKKGKWNSVTPETLLIKFSSMEEIRTFLNIELRVVMKYLMNKRGLKGIKESVPKYQKVKELAKFLNIIDADKTHFGDGQGKKGHKQPKSLSEIASKAIDKYSKIDLNIILAEYYWQDRYIKWISTIREVTVDGEHYEWFYQPEYSNARQQLEVKCIDSTHLLTRTRRKSCRGGLDGLSNEAWKRVAKSRKTILTQVMVEEVTDPMSVSMAKTHFSESVESVMRINLDMDSANLCRDIRHWWESEDNAGIPAVDRVRLRQSLRKRLLDKVDFGSFPPPTMHVSGWPIQLWEGILANIDAKLLLYGISHNGTYNVRAFSSMIGETYFAELTNFDRRGQGTVTCEEFGQFIGNTIEQVQIRMDPDRHFSYCTSRSTVYQAVEDVDNIDDTTESHSDQCHCCIYGFDTLPGNLVPRNHHFDTPERKRLDGRRKQNTVSTSRHCLQNRALGVRWEKARCNIAKLLPTKRMGIPSGLSPLSNNK